MSTKCEEFSGSTLEYKTVGECPAWIAYLAVKNMFMKSAHGLHGGGARLVLTFPATTTLDGLFVFKSTKEGHDFWTNACVGNWRRCTEIYNALPEKKRRINLN